MKEPLRKHFRALRDAVPGPKRAAASSAIALHVQGLEAWRDARVVLLYASFGSEVDTRALLEAAWSAGKRACLPRIQGSGLVAHEVDRASVLVPNRFGIPEPTSAAPEVPAPEVRFVAVPGVAFDRRGARLGYGGGYYDRLLGTVPHAYRVGIAFDAQVVGHLPTTHLDVPMDALVTESGVQALPQRRH